MSELVGALLVITLFLGAAFYFSKHTKINMDKTTPTPPPIAENVTKLTTEDLVVGTGAEATVGKKLSMHYVGTLIDGTKFDSSRDRGTPFEFTLGAGEVIPGWDQGILDMKVGGKRKLTIPSNLAYGSRTIGTIPPNSTLVFEVELLGVK